MEERQISIKELLQITVDELNKILVPVAYANEISRPLCQAVANIQNCIDAIGSAPQDEPKEGEVNGVSD